MLLIQASLQWMLSFNLGLFLLDVEQSCNSLTIRMAHFIFIASFHPKLQATSCSFQQDVEVISTGQIELLTIQTAFSGSDSMFRNKNALQISNQLLSAAGILLHLAFVSSHLTVKPTSTDCENMSQTSPNMWSSCWWPCQPIAPEFGQLGQLTASVMQPLQPLQPSPLRAAPFVGVNQVSGWWTAGKPRSVLLPNRVHPFETSDDLTYLRSTLWKKERSSKPGLAWRLPGWSTSCIADQLSKWLIWVGEFNWI